MNTRTKAVLMAAAIAMSAAALGSQAAGGHFETQLEMTDGFSTEPFHPKQTAFNPATPRQAAEDSWFDRERAAPQVLVPYVAPGTPVAVQPARVVTPATPRQAAEDRWYDAERANPYTAEPFPLPSTGN